MVAPARNDHTGLLPADAAADLAQSDHTVVLIADTEVDSARRHQKQNAVLHAGFWDQLAGLRGLEAIWESGTKCHCH